jgi:hypothetical protein
MSLEGLFLESEHMGFRAGSNNDRLVRSMNSIVYFVHGKTLSNPIGINFSGTCAYRRVRGMRTKGWSSKTWIRFMVETYLIRSIVASVLLVQKDFFLIRLDFE